MPVTQFRNVEDELKSQVGIDPEKLSVKSSKCSCPDCDSKVCFEKRKRVIKSLCQCDICGDLKVRSTLPIKIIRKNRTDPESATRKIIKEIVTRETIETLKRVTETMYEFDTNKDFEMVTETQPKLSDMKVLPSPTKSQTSHKIECCIKASSGNNVINIKKERLNSRPILVTSTDMDRPNKENTVTKLSAQVMNVPYVDLHEPVQSSDPVTEANALSKLNIFKRIKEIYEACSCKVCECISSKPRDFRDDFCKCKPCQCQDCVKSRKLIEEKIKRACHLGCPCIRCDNKDCRGIAKDTCDPQVCDCGGLYDSNRYPGNFGKRCKCKPCECISCKLSDRCSSKTVKLEQVNEFIERETCHCSPCECIECKQIYNRTSPTIMCTHSTDTTKYRNYCHCNDCHTEYCQLGEIESCTCESHDKAVRKIFDKSYNDYDIRTLVVDNNAYINQQKQCKFANHNTIALFASLKNNYPSNSCNRSVCKCTNCECILCSARDDSMKNYEEHFSHNDVLHDNINEQTSITNACKCTPCECEICSKKRERADHIAFESKCRCDVCVCLKCDNTTSATSSVPTSPLTPCRINRSHSAKPIRSINMNKNCSCNTCDCSNCKKLFSCSSSVQFYSNGKSVEKKAARRLRKVMLITPSTSESHLKSRKTYAESISSTVLSPKDSTKRVFGQDLSTCHAISDNYIPISHMSNIRKDQISQLYQSTKECSIISDDDIDREMFFKLNDHPVLDTASFKSLEETTIQNHVRDFCQKYDKVNQNQDAASEVTSKSYTRFNKYANDMTSKESDELLPVFWSYCNESSYPSFSRNIKRFSDRTRSNLKDDVSNRLNKSLSPGHKQDNKSDKTREDTFSDYVKHSYHNENNHYTCNYECGNIYEQSHKHTDYFSLTANNNNHEHRKTIVNHSDITSDYERATRVLWEAKAFSTKLIKMLDSFENANRHFESASQKFKVLHESLLNINESELDKKYCTNLERMRKSILGNYFEIISEDENVKNENEAEREYETYTSTSKDKQDNYQYTEDSIPTKYDMLDTNIKKNNEKKDVNEQENKIDAINDVNMLQKCKLQSEFDKKFHEVENLPSKKTSQVHVSITNVLNSSRADFNIESSKEIENKNVENIKQTPPLLSDMQKLGSVLEKKTTTDTAVATDDVKKTLIELSEQEDQQPWQIFKKNLYLNAADNDKRMIFQSPALEFNVKEAIQAISLQTTNEVNAKFIPRPNEALVNLQSEVNDLLNMSSLQSNSRLERYPEADAHLFPRSKLDVHAKSLSSDATSQTYEQTIERADKEVYFNITAEIQKVNCEQLKANFVGLRRVSDHTVLVKWVVPERIEDVQGYELLVDGRAVQKIFSPTRSMAVVTCLPHAARVLLTIQTIASADCGHQPASSIVYRPRMK